MTQMQFVKQFKMPQHKRHFVWCKKPVSFELLREQLRSKVK